MSDASDSADVQSYEQTPDEIDQMDQDQLQPYNNLDSSVVADALDDDRVAAALRQMRAGIAATAARMPPHAATFGS